MFAYMNQVHNGADRLISDSFSFATKADGRQLGHRDGAFAFFPSKGSQFRFGEQTFRDRLTFCGNPLCILPLSSRITASISSEKLSDVPQIVISLSNQ